MSVNGTSGAQATKWFHYEFCGVECKMNLRSKRNIAVINRVRKVTNERHLDKESHKEIEIE